MIIFPPSIIKDDMNRPVIIFRNKVLTAQTDQHIVFPIPQSLQFSDSAAYNNTELGFGGSMIVNGGRSGSVSDATTNLASQMSSVLPKNLKNLAGLLGAAATGGKTQSAIGIATGTTMNKNIVTEFTGVGTRQFSFQFKLMTTSVKESNLVKQICDTFRSGLYPEGDSLQLRYPPTWYINFKKGGRDIPYIPKIFETYLTSMSTSYNNSMNLFHVDGSPVEIDLQLTFMESRTLTKQDVDSLVEKPFQDGDFTRSFNMSSETKQLVEEKKAADAAAAKTAAGETKN